MAGTEGWTVKLDDKYKVKTPMGKLLVLPTEKLANSVAVEWDAQKDNIVFAIMPITSLSFKATDKCVSF